MDLHALRPWHAINAQIKFPILLQLHEIKGHVPFGKKPANQPIFVHVSVRRLFVLLHQPLNEIERQGVELAARGDFMLEFGREEGGYHRRGKVCVVGIVEHRTKVFIVEGVGEEEAVVVNLGEKSPGQGSLRIRGSVCVSGRLSGVCDSKELLEELDGFDPIRCVLRLF